MKYSNEELSAIIERELHQALGSPESEIADIRLRNLQYYKAEPIGDLAAPDIPDRSSIVASDCADTVNWMLPSLLRPFATAKDSVSAEPASEMCAPNAKLVAESLQHIFWNRNDGFNVLHTLFKDALIQKVGFAKVAWEIVDTDAEETYTGLLPEQVQELLNNPDVTPISQEARIEIIQGQQVELFDLQVKRQERKGCCKVVNVPPEEMRIHPRARYGDDETLLFIAQERYETRAQLEADGYDLSNVSTDQDYSLEEIERMDSQSRWMDDDSDGELERYKVAECYIKLDQDDDGIPEWRRILMIGSTIMEDDKVDDHPFVYFCPEPMPHVFFGECPVDHAIGPQRLRTALMRGILDNVYLSVNKRMGVIEGQVNLDDLINNRPGGIVRMKSNQALMPIEQGGLDSAAWQLQDWAESWREQRTGYTRYSQGLSPDALNPTATGVALITEKADQRTELVARVAAETAVRILFEKMLKCICRYQDKADQVELFGQWLTIDPREWANGYRIRIEIGLGTGNRDRMAQIMQTIMQIQGPLMQAGLLPPAAGIMAARKFAESAGVVSPEMYFPDPPPPQPPQEPPMPPQVMVEQMRIQADAQKFQAETQVKTQQADVERQMRMAETQAEIESRERIELAKLSARRQERLLELAAGIMAARANPGITNLTNGTQIDQTAQSPGFSLADLEAMAGQVQALSNAIQGGAQQ